MKSVIRWAITNTPAMNTLMVAVMAVGLVSLWLMRREVFPEFELEIIQVTVPYPGASPSEVEEGICQKIEEAVQAIAGIKKLNSMSREGTGTVVLELESDVPDVQKILNEVRSEIDRIPSFPELAEDPKITQITLRNAAIRVGVMGPDTNDPHAEVQLREVTERIRRELLQLPSVSQATIIGGRDYQIDIEIPEATLRAYGLTLQHVADLVRRENIELPGGKVKTETQEVLLRGKNKQLTGTEIAKIPLVTQPNGVVLTVGDLGTVRDEFVDTTAISRINGRPGLIISVDKTASEDLLKIVDEVRNYLARLQDPESPESAALPPGYDVDTWADRSTMVFDRMELLARNGLQGLVLVFVVLAVFLERRLAFWVALGIPISMLGACGILLAAGQTLNMLSMFAFLMVLGILVDDAIVVGENVFTHRQLGKGFVAAAIDGTHEVLPSVIASVTTTVIAFMPLLFVPGVMGKFIAVMPLAVIVMLVLSLLESTFILPCHLAHSGEHAIEAARRGYRRDFPWWAKLIWSVFGVFLLFLLLLAARGTLPVSLSGFSLLEMSPFWQFVVVIPWVAVALLPWLWYPFLRLGDGLGWLNDRVTRRLEWVIERVYAPSIRYALNHPSVVISGCVAILLLLAGLVIRVPFNAFPKLDVDWIQAKVTYPDGTSAAVSRVASERLEAAIRQINKDYIKDHGKPLVRIFHQAVGSVNMSGDPQESLQQSGSHIASVGVEMVPTDQREYSSMEVIDMWRSASGSFPGAESVTFSTQAMGPGGAAIEFKLLAAPEYMDQLERATEEVKQRLAAYTGVRDIYDDSAPGKVEFQITVKDDAKAMGLTLADVAGTVRASYYGEEVMRLQRGRHEVKLMVRYPQHERQSLARFDDIRIRTGDGAERPITELADIDVKRGYSQIARLDQQRAITITADVDEKEANARNIVDEMRTEHVKEILAKYPHVSVRWEGQAEQTSESIAGLMQGLGVALIVMFALLTLEFRSYFQPFLILAIIPFGFFGAIVGHLVLQLPITLFSLFGLVALTGVVVNDSIVLIDFINHRVRDGVPLKEALVDAGCRRLRPVMLTSLTTIVGLLPIMLERSLQAQVVIPMATSLAFGLLFTTLLVLLIVPSFYYFYARLMGQIPDAVKQSLGVPTPAPGRQLEVENKEELEVLSP